MSDHHDVSAIILAAGKGTRMGSDRAKVLHEVAGQAMVLHVLDTCEALGIGQRVVVVGHQREAVEALVAGRGVDCVLQDRQLGTGHAVQVCAGTVRGSTCIVLCGDAPLVPAVLLAELLDRRRASGAACVAVAAEMDDPTGYGRMIRNASGGLVGIIEHKDASEEQRQVRLVNSGIFAFDRAKLFAALGRIRNDNAQGEYYLTDVVKLLVDDDECVELVTTADVASVFGVNTPADLAAAEAMFLARRQGR
jgi:UDP-N-acetylglucosamine diphosphorylase/glucosamine-1-phosphate N-acetyltransferase